MRKGILNLLVLTVLAAAMLASPELAHAVGPICRVWPAAPGATHDGSSWTNAYTDLQAPLAVPGCTEIWVAAAIYKPGASDADTFSIPAGTAIYGGFAGTENARSERDWVANLTILSGDIAGDDTTDANGVVVDANNINVATANSQHVVTMDGTAAPVYSSTILDGFTITAGQASGIGSYPEAHGAGLYCNGQNAGHVCSPTLTNLRFRGNQEGALELYAVGGGTSSPTLGNVSFEGNSATVEGGAIISLSQGVGGISNPVLTNVTFQGNRAGSGGAMATVVQDSGTSNPAFTNVTFSGNSAVQNGGALYFGAGATSNPSLVNVTFSGNSADGTGGAIYNEAPSTGSSNPVVTNAILWGNTAPSAPEAYGGSAIAISYSDVQGGCASIGGPGGATCGSGNLASNPSLGGLAGNGGFTQTMALVAGSPAIDAGTNTGCPLSDQRGSPRPIDGDGNGSAICDMGAFEYNPAYLAWVGGISVTADANVIAAGRPQIGPQVMAYDGFTAGGTTMYVPMLFRRAFGGTYNAALYVQNVDAANTASITLTYYDTSGSLTCSHGDTIPPLSSHGYWMPAECMSDGWVGGVVITSNHNIVAVGRPHVGSEITTYNGFSSGGLSMYVPMLFRRAFGGTYNAALYVQNTDPSHTASLFIQYYDVNGQPTCGHADSIPRLASHGYWMPTECMPDGWVGSAVITSDYNIVAVGRPHIDTQVTAYDGFAGGTTTAYLPMVYKRASAGADNTAFYIQDLDGANAASVTLDFYDRSGSLTCSTLDSIPVLSSHGYWTPTFGCLPDGWTGGVVITADRNVVALGRPHFGSEVFAYDGFTGGAVGESIPMLFSEAYGGAYNSAYYLQNVDSSNTASLTVRFYDVYGIQTCTKTLTLGPLAAADFWVPDVLATCP